MNSKLILKTALSILLLSATGLLAQKSPYAKWSNGPPTSPDFFPIGVWMQQPHNAQRFKALGINIFIGLWDGPTQDQLTEMKKQGMPVVGYQTEVALNSPDLPLIRAWLQTDEPDNAQSDGNGGYGPPIKPEVIVEHYKAMRKADPTRPVYLNFGRGVSHEDWGGRGVRAGHLEDYPEYIKGADIIAFDIYPMANCEPPALGKPEYVARGVERLVKWAKGKKIVWNYVECTHIQSESMATPEEVRAEVWMSLIHGSQGILYFVHEWYPDFCEEGLLRYPKMMAAVKKINAQITALAPVLNSPTIDKGAKVKSSKKKVPVACMVKKYRGSTYLFAVCMRRETTKASFQVRGLPRQATAKVLGEDRRIRVRGGKLQDEFEPYGVHLYQIEHKAAKAAKPTKATKKAGTQKEAGQ